METVSYSDFEKIDIRLGKIIEVEDFAEARKPSFKLKIDFGPEIGIKTSGAQLMGAHGKNELNGMFVMCVVNFPPKKIGPFSLSTKIFL
jgi:tRNA-binding protein